MCDLETIVMVFNTMFYLCLNLFPSDTGDIPNPAPIERHTGIYRGLVLVATPTEPRSGTKDLPLSTDLAWQRASTIARADTGHTKVGHAYMIVLDINVNLKALLFVQDIHMGLLKVEGKHNFDIKSPNPTTWKDNHWFSIICEALFWKQ